MAYPLQASQRLLRFMSSTRKDHIASSAHFCLGRWNERFSTVGVLLDNKISNETCTVYIFNHTFFLFCLQQVLAKYDGKLSLI